MKLLDVFRPVDPVMLAIVATTAAYHELRGRGLGVAVLAATVWLVFVLLRLLAQLIELNRAVQRLPDTIGTVAAAKMTASLTPPELKP